MLSSLASLLCTCKSSIYLQQGPPIQVHDTYSWNARSVMWTPMMALTLFVQSCPDHALMFASRHSNIFYCILLYPQDIAGEHEVGRCQRYRRCEYPTMHGWHHLGWQGRRACALSQELLGEWRNKSLHIGKYWKLGGGADKPSSSSRQTCCIGSYWLKERDHGSAKIKGPRPPKAHSEFTATTHHRHPHARSMQGNPADHLFENLYRHRPEDENELRT